ncbi:MAG: family 20 glycosylhydrolase [Fibrobacteres bacterium]|nr:family 20 glycosylhydrolase [Fibrobacterota bacterium]
MKSPAFLIPPKKFKLTGGTYKFPKTPIVTSVLKEDSLAVNTLIKRMAVHGLHSIFARDAISPAVLILRNGAIKEQEGYLLECTKTGITVTSSTAAGAFYGICTLMELLTIYGTTIPCCRIEDAPQFKRRGVYFDCSRGKVPKLSTLKSLIDLLASWKTNELQIYIENVFTFKKHPAIGKGFDPFTPGDIKELQDYCNERFINFVPSLASFGHMEKILMLPGYSKLGELPGHRNMAGGTTLNPSHPGSIKLVEDLFAEFVPLFKATDFNVCGDEPWELGKGASKKAAAKRGVGTVYLDFIIKIRELCFKHNKRMNLWSDIVLNHPEIIPDIPKDIVMLNWQYDMAYKERRLQRSNEITDAGLPLVCCPGTNSWQSHGTRFNMATEVVSQFAKRGRELNAEGFMNTDWGDSGHRNTLAISLCSFAHGASHAWNTAETEDKTHAERFTKHTFNDTTGKMAAALKILGEPESKQWAYVSFNESLYSPKPFFHFYSHDWVRMDITDFPKEMFVKKDAAFSKMDFISLNKSEDPFMKLMAEEFDLAASMDRLAWKRLSIAKRVRSQAKVSSNELKSHKSELTDLSRNFASIWKKINRPSRLCDNMEMFSAAIKEINYL